MTAGQKQIWALHYKGDAAAQKDRNRSFELACQTGPDKITFEGKSDQHIKTQYNDLLRRKRGQRFTGGAQRVRELATGD